MNILITGGAGYIGSHTVLELLKDGNNITVIDNLSNSSEESLCRVVDISGSDSLLFQQGDIRDEIFLKKIFAADTFDAVIHFAGLKAVGESVSNPLYYYHNNVAGTLTLLKVMEEYGVLNLVFSSSATVYGNPASLPIREDFPTGPTTNAYGASKLMIEQILMDITSANKAWNIACLRYFNPVGAHESGMIGEDPDGIPNNLMPYIAKVALGKVGKLSVYGDDYDTMDGTGVRDYIHVVDLAIGHSKTLSKLRENPGFVTYNLGTGKGFSVLEMIHTFEKVNDVEVPYEIAPRRDGDVDACFADPTLAFDELNWKAKFTLEDMVRDTWRWQSQNPDGYDK